MTEVLGEAVIRQPLMSGHCSVGGTGHERCQRNGGGQRANPQRIFQPCPCLCHYVNDDGDVEVLECGACGGEIVETYWPLDADGDVRYAHVDLEADRVTGEECTRSAPVSRNTEPDEPKIERLRTCPQCGMEMDADDPNRLCGECTDADDDFADLDDFSDLDDL